LVEVYEVSRLYFYHFDFYRFDSPSELAEAGFREYFHPDGVCLIEWPEKAGPQLPVADLSLVMHVTATGRRVEVFAATEAGRQCLRQLGH
jgi:tRNA threonylcarbamoyladenosine biosynthesis protein TsaE